MSNDERKVNPIKELLYLTQENFDLGVWNFQESFRSTQNKIVIFDSKMCRIKFSWEDWDPLGGNTISIIYGRLHAHNEEALMVWEGEERYCWHEMEYALHFLDKRSPSDAVDLGLSHFVLDKYYEEKYRLRFHRRQPEWLMTMHTEVWENYGSRFFELFDLRRPGLWEQYRKFLKEFHDIKGRSSFIDPSLDKVC